VLIGEPGVGKTAIVEGLATRIVDNDVPDTPTSSCTPWTWPPWSPGPATAATFEERLKKVLKEIKTRGDIVLFIDEIHTFVGAGGAEGAIDAASILKPMLARGELQTVIGATTSMSTASTSRKTQPSSVASSPVKVESPPLAHTIEILKGHPRQYEAHHRVTITDHALVAAVNLADRYISDRFLPDKAIDLIDEAGSRLRMNKRPMRTPPTLIEMITEVQAPPRKRR
jgi:ATP-dependent Clp protease ATP-binding subunit ClpC